MKAKVMKYEVNHERTSGGPQFSSLSEALAYISHVMRHGMDRVLTISKIQPN
jgi:hypothetical protein